MPSRMRLAAALQLFNVAIRHSLRFDIVAFHNAAVLSAIILILAGEPTCRTLS